MKGIKILKLVLLLLLSLGSGSCVFEKFAEVSTGEEPVKVGLSTRAFTQGGVTISTFRIIAFNAGGSPEINKTMDDLVISGNNLTLDLRPGMYTLFAIGNERADMTPLLEGAASEQVVDDVCVNLIENQDSTTLPVAWKKTVYVRQKTGGSDIGQISLNNRDWLDRMEMETERLASKIEIYVRKESAADEVVVKTVTPKNMPKFSHITPKAYSGEYYFTPLNVNHTVTETQTLMTDRIYPEHIPALPADGTVVELEMEINGGIQKAILDAGQLDRNKIYRYEVLVKSRGIEIENIQVLPWVDASTDENIQGVEFNLSRVEVPYSFGQESKVYFTTKNIPESSLTLSKDLYSGDGSLIKIGGLFGEFYIKLDYSYNPDTKLGSGYLTLKRRDPSFRTYCLRLDAAGISKFIKVGAVEFAGSNIYIDRTTSLPTFYDTPTNGEIPSHSDFVGVYFKWGSLVAIPALSEGSYSNLPVIWTATGSPKANLDHFYTEKELISKGMELRADIGEGNICEYMTRRGYAPKNKKWRYPSYEEISGVKVTVTSGIPSSGVIPEGTSNSDTKFQLGNNVSLPAVFNYSYSVLNRRLTVTSNLGQGYGKNAWYTMNHFNSASSNMFVLYTTVTLSYGEGTVRYDFSRSSDVSTSMSRKFFAVRCVVDDSPGAILPLYKLTYDISDPEATITAPTPEGIILNQHADAGGSINLSETVLTSSDGRVHNGWVINGKEYDLGAVVSNIQSDMVAQPRWFGHNINGVVWASTNLKAPKEFAPRPGSTYNNNYFPGNSLIPGGEEQPPFNPDRDPCPAGWRTPVKKELEDLLASGYMAVNGGFYFGTTTLPDSGSLSDYLFFPATGYMNQYGAIVYKDWQLLIPSRELDTSASTQQYYTVSGNLTNGILSLGRYSTRLGMPIRCVKQ